MPIYEFICRHCNRIYSFHSFKADLSKQPTCPQCKATDLERVPSSFGIKKGSTIPSGGLGNMNEQQMEGEMMRLASELEGVDENDPRAMASAVRRMAEIAGQPVTATMDEMIRRLEAGEDPERIEEELGDALEEELGELDEAGGGPLGGAPSRDSGLYPM